jgi:hypothetical protein
VPLQHARLPSERWQRRRVLSMVLDDLRRPRTSTSAGAEPASCQDSSSRMVTAVKLSEHGGI